MAQYIGNTPTNVLVQSTEVNDLTSIVTWANVPDANITQSSVTQHQAALSITESQISDLQSYLTSTDLTGYATESYVTIAIGNVIDAAPAALDTLNELAAALGDDANFASTVTSTLATKITASSTDTLTNKTFTGYTETVFALGTSGTISLNPTNGTIQTCALSGAATFTDSISNGQSIILMLTGGDTNVVTWPTITWVTSVGNLAPTLTAANGIVLWKINTTLYGAIIGSYV